MEQAALDCFAALAMTVEADRRLEGPLHSIAHMANDLGRRCLREEVKRERGAMPRLPPQL
ncbi:hypothetical protein AE618_23100 [Bosea vaviloviae]|uniref:Uncharacterized protein n=1 Tax=Bosea vaviloviae TaxID=1526658 RepID=A0A0N1F0P4_9HYPH|nr:hypothetical protein AE618_23100 [Bosea vaviloviae]